MRESLSIFCPSMGGHEEAVTSWQDTYSKPWDIEVDYETEGEEAGFLTKCDRFWRETDAEIIGYLHSDFYTLEHGWDERILREFQVEETGVVGVVGATALGHPDLYRIPYDFRQLARSDVYSNLTDWEAHGQRETGSKKVAVVDSCAVFVRRSLLSRCNGWPVDIYPNSSHCSDLWICCIAARYGMDCRMVGIACSHRSGGKGQAGSQWLDSRGGDTAIHRKAHELIYQDFRDILPVRVK